MAKQIDENIYSRSFVEAVDATKFARVRLVTQRSQLGKSENRVEERLGRIACGGCYEFFPSFISFNVYIILVSTAKKTVLPRRCGLRFLLAPTCKL